MAAIRIVKLSPSRELCGTTEAQFADLMVRLAPLVTERDRVRADRPDRKRAPGAGRKPFPFWLRLFVALTHLRQGTTVRATGAIFGIHERSVRRYRDEIAELLAAHGFDPPGASKPIRTLEDLASYIEDVDSGVILIDTTEVRRSTPYPWEEQKKAFSGKSKTHVVKTTVISDGDRRPLWVEANPTGEGRTFDITMLRSQTALLAMLATLAAAGVLVVADKGFRGLRDDLGPDAVVMPHRRHPGGEYTEEQKTHNRAVSTLRMPVEHAIGRMKWWKALDHWRRPADRFDETAKAIGVLATLT